MRDVHVIDEPDIAAVILDPLRARLLAELTVPGSATTVAAALDLPRQKVNYHLRALENVGLVRQVTSRQRRGLTERVLESSARSYVVSPAVLGPSTPEPARTDRLSTAYLVAVAARLLREVGELAHRAERAAKPLPTLTIDTEVCFASAADRAAFTAELADAVTRLVGRYHAGQAPGGRLHRLVVASHPIPAPPSTAVGVAHPTEEIPT